MELSQISSRYHVRPLEEEDIPEVYALCRENRAYYEYCPPFVTPVTIAADRKALPPGKDPKDKYYLGFFCGSRLLAVLDLILAYPNAQTAFIGFFMTDRETQGRGLGSEIIEELCGALKNMGFAAIRLGWVQGNPQAEHFWHKNRFRETRVTYQTAHYTVVVAQRAL